MRSGWARKQAFPAAVTTVVVIFAASVVILVASGALMSIKSGAGNLTVLIHRIGAAVAVCSAGTTIFLLKGIAG